MTTTTDRSSARSRDRSRHGTGTHAHDSALPITRFVHHSCPQEKWRRQQDNGERCRGGQLGGRGSAAAPPREIGKTSKVRVISRLVKLGWGVPHRGQERRWQDGRGLEGDRDGAREGRWCLCFDSCGLSGAFADPSSAISSDDVVVVVCEDRSGGVPTHLVPCPQFNMPKHFCL
jgi:hypothetical protein